MAETWHTLTARVRFDPDAATLTADAMKTISNALAEALDVQRLTLDGLYLIADDHTRAAHTTEPEEHDR